MDPLYHLKTTPYGGRGLFATKSVPKDTLLHSCPSPYASVIFRVFRKEVCAECFAYAFEARRNTWNVHSEPGHGVWFCGENCRALWLSGRNVGGLLGLMNATIDKFAQSMRKCQADTEASSPALVPNQISLEFLDIAWKNAEMVTGPKGKSGSVDDMQLSDMEVDTARFVVSAIIQRHLEETIVSGSSNGPSGWSDFLQLQENELSQVRSRPHIMDSHLRVYTFLRKVLVPVLQVYVVTSDTVRAILGRSQTNAFGIWDMSTEDDGEMLGWGMYISGSYFNHDCMPNVRKKRIGRTLNFYTTRNIEQGEELCINYIDVKDVGQERRGQLQDNWYFGCACRLCAQELAIVNDLPE